MARVSESSTSIIIAAHNEAAILGRSLDLLLDGLDRSLFEVIVVANGCADATAEIASARDVVVVDLPKAGKSAALNAGDAVATGEHRIYLDADVAASGSVAAALIAALDSDDRPRLLAYPDRLVATNGRPLPVRWYYAIQTRLPASRTGAFGRGMIALSAQGRQRFDQFPELIADDLFLDGLFHESERVLVEDVFTVVQTPARTRDLVRRLTRVRQGNLQLRRAAERDPTVTTGSVRQSNRLSWLRDVVLHEPLLAPAGIVFATLTVIADLRARRGGHDWGTERIHGGSRDEAQ